MQHFARHPNHIPQNGNACKHIIRAPKLYVLEQRNVVMSRSWPAFSLDANHFEHLLDDFQRHLNIFQPRPATTDELFAIRSPDVVRRLNNVLQTSDSFHEQNVIIIHATECKETLYVIIRKYLSDYT